MRLGRFTFHIGYAGRGRRLRPPFCVICGERIRFVTAREGRKYHHVRCVLRRH